MKTEGSIEYQLFPLPFTVLTLCGSWHPENWSLERKRLYKIFTAIVLFLGITLFVEMLVNIIVTFGTKDFNTEDIFATIVFGVGIYKEINILYYRSNVITFINKYMNSQWQKPRNDDEAKISTETQSETRWVSFAYAIFIITAICLRSVTPILEAGTFMVLPLNAWYPYDAEDIVTFFLTYLHQIISGVTLTCMHLSTDTLFVGLLLQMCYQLNILKSRLSEFHNAERSSENGESTAAVMMKYIRQHESIFRFGFDLQKTFKPILLGQMMVVVPNLIINVYTLSVNTHNINLQYFTTFFYALVSVMQIYMFCWYGNEIFLNSIGIGDALYECDWSTLDQKTKKIILTMMIRTSKSIIISAAAIIPLNIDIFIQIMKTSYSAFNLLQQTSVQ